MTNSKHVELLNSNSSNSTVDQTTEDRKDGGQEGMDLDDLQARIGGMSRYQIAVIVLVTAITIATGPASQINVFIGGIPEFRCSVPGVDDMGGPEVTLNMTEDDFHKIVSPLSPTHQTFDPCHRRDVDVLSCALNGSSCEPKSDRLVACESGYRYDNSTFVSTVSTEFDVVCGRKIWMTIANSVFFIGYFVGSAMCGPACDWFGRKKSILMWWSMYCVFQIAIAFTPSFPLYSFLRVCVAVPYVAIYISVFTYAAEISPAKNRTHVALWVSLSSSIAHTSLPVIAYFFRNWRKLELVTGIIPLPCILVIVLLPESPRWLLSVGRSEAARKVVEKYARSNNRQLNKRDWELVVETERRKGSEHRSAIKYSMLDLFRAPRTRMLSCAVAYAWFTVNFVYYGLILNVGNLAGDMYMNGLLNAGIEIIGNLIVLLVPCTGKRNMTSFSYLLSGVACLTSTVCTVYGARGSVGAANAGRGLAIIGKMGAQASFLLIYSVTADIYPTILRGTGIGLGSMMARIGGIATPFTVELQESIPWLTQVIFGLLALVASFVCLLFPETENSSCLTTLQESEEFFRSNMTFYNSIFGEEDHKEIVDNRIIKFQMKRIDPESSPDEDSPMI